MPRPNYTTVTFPNGLVSPLSPYGGRHLRSLSNCWIAQDDWGAVEAMPGFDVYSSGTATGVQSMVNVHVGIDTTAFTEKVYVSGQTAGDVTVWEVDSSTYTSRKTGLSLTKTPISAQIRNNLVFVNGSDTPFQIDLSTDAVSNVGVTRPDITQGGGVTTATNAGGSNNVKGIVKYWIAEVSTTTEGALSAEFGEIDCADGNRVDITFPNNAEYNSKTFRIYRTLADGSHPFFLVQYDVGATGGTYTDDISDSNLGNLPYLHGDPPPSALISIVNQFNRLWGITRDGILYWSDLADHESWWTASNGNWTPIFEDDGDEATGLALAPDGLYVFKKAHVYHVYCQQLDAMQVTPLSLAGPSARSLGASQQQAIVHTREGVAFYHDANVFLLRGLQFTPIGDAVNEDLRGGAAYRTSGDPSITLGYSDQTGHLWVSNNTDGDSLVYDFQRREWVGTYEYSFAGLAEGPGGFYGAGGGGATNQGKNALKLYSTETDSNGDAIATSCRLAPFVGSIPTSDKQFLYADLLLDRESSDSDLSVNLIIDSDDTNAVAVTVPMDESGNTQSRIRRSIAVGFRGRELTLEITSTSASPRWKVYGVVFSWHEFRTSVSAA